MSRIPPNQLAPIAVLLAVLFVVHVVNVLSGMALTAYGVIPRSLTGLRGILFSPLLHGSWAHLLANVVPFGALLGLLAFARGAALWPIVAAVWLGSGMAVWLVGRPGAVQVGASGVIYGLAAFLLASAWLQRDLKSALAALVFMVLYGGIVWGIFPTRQGVSWEGHLSGAVIGVLVAMQFAAPQARR